MQTLAPYIIGRRLGRGGLADVHAAIRRSDGREVAVKIARGRRSHDSWVRRRFWLEAAMLRRAASRHVVGLFARGIDDGRPFLVLALAEGGSLAERISDRPTTPEGLRRLTVDLAAAIRSFHDAGMHHLDVTPGNLLVTGAFDDGAGLIAAGERLVIADPSVSFTPAGAERPWLEFGTPRWRAPEIAAGRPAGVATDVFGASATLWGAMARAAPPEAIQRSAVIASMPAHWQSVFGPGLAEDPAARHSSIDDWSSSVLSAIEHDRACARA